MSDPSILDVRGLTVRYRTVHGDITAVDDVDLSVESGEILGIAGESGCGKTTLATALLGLLRPPGYLAAGEATFRATGVAPINLLATDERRLRTIRWRQIAYLPQASMNSLNPVMRIRDQFLDVMEEHGEQDRDANNSHVIELLSSVGLKPLVADRYPHELSGGMRQRALLAMAVALRPDLLIADEPTTALDVVIQRVIIQNLRQLRDSLGVTIIVITHDMAVHAQLTDRVAVMHNGRLVEIGDTCKVFKAPEHPYTLALISSIPTLAGRTARGLAQEAGR